MAKFLKVLLIVLLSILALTAALTAVFFAMTAGAKLDEDKLINYSNSITILDDNGEEIVNSSVNGRKNTVQINELNKDTINAFIASEDRSFYSHNGLNFKRMVKALYKNLTSRSFKEGASTISQQLIKNTHLSGDKTISRKLNEIRLTMQLENKYTKDEILEMYLNTIYFGHNCYGLGNAAIFYFDEKAENLTLEQSATLAGLLTSPNNLSPFKNEEKCKQKRDIVLNCMLECGYIESGVYNYAIALPLSAKRNNGQELYSGYLSKVYDELDELEFDTYYLTDGCKVNTYLNKETQEKIEELTPENDYAAIVTDLKTCGVTAYKSTISDAKRQPGSTIKPLLVYAPAIEEKLIYPATKINDEKIDYNGYSPENYDKKYRGYTSVTDCIKQSLNVPAVKTLNALTTDKAADYAEKFSINLENDEKNLSLALGGMKYGLTLKELCDCYSVFPNGGEMIKTQFIKSLEDKNGNIIYTADRNRQKIFSESTCSLMNEMLIETAQSGTAKKINDLPYSVAAKTGTCGNKDGNYDAYSICYTSSNVIGVWIGSSENMPLDITGGGLCTQTAKEIIKQLYNDYMPENLDTTSGTTTIEIDRQDYNNNNEIILADKICPELNKIKIKCPANNTPANQSTKYSNPTINKPKITVNSNEINIVLCQTEYYHYIINRIENNENTLVYEGKWIDKFYDTVENGSYIYTVTPYYLYGDKKYYGQTVTLPQIIVDTETTPQKQEIPDIAKREWYYE